MTEKINSNVLYCFVLVTDNCLSAARNLCAEEERLDLEAYDRLDQAERLEREARQCDEEAERLEMEARPGVSW